MHAPALSCPVFQSASCLPLVCPGLSPYYLRTYMYGLYTEQVRSRYGAGGKMSHLSGFAHDLILPTGS